MNLRLIWDSILDLFVYKTELYGPSGTVLRTFYACSRLLLRAPVLALSSWKVFLFDKIQF